MSQDARDALSEFPEFITEPRGEISVKVSQVIFVHFALHIPSISVAVNVQLQMSNNIFFSCLPFNQCLLRQKAAQWNLNKNHINFMTKLKQNELVQRMLHH